MVDYKDLYEDVSFIRNAVSYTDKPFGVRVSIKAEATRILDKLGRRERITQDEIGWLQKMKAEM